jgi:hypothetical protein
MELASYRALYMKATLYASIGLVCSHSINDHFCQESIDNSQLERSCKLQGINSTHAERKVN